MKKLQVIAYVIFILGLITRLLHYNGSVFTLMFGTLLILIYSILLFFINGKEKLPASLLHLGVAFLTIYFLFRLLFMYGGPMILGYSLLFIVTFGISIPALITNFGKRTSVELPQILFLLYYLFFIYISFIHSDRLYYFLNLNELTQTERRIEDYRAWDRYSWFLYLVNKQDEATEANLTAQRILEAKLKKERNAQLLMDLETIKNHNQLIRNRNWTDNR